MIYLQRKFNLIELNPDDYFVSKVPVEISIQNILSFNFLIIFCSIITFLIPMLIISRLEMIKILKIK